jgi:hypothetical protein
MEKLGMTNGNLSADHEGLIVQLLGEALVLVELLAEQLPQRGAAYYLQSLFMILRQMGYFFTQNNSPLASQIGALSTAEAGIAARIKTIRDTIGHRESEDNYASPTIKLVGGMRFEEGDVEIQYGATRIWLLAEILSNHRRYRVLFRSAPELSGLSQHPMWAFDDEKLSSAEALLTEKLRKPEELLRTHHR